ncbi:unnamed protein product [Alopecurus aequalis]
MAAATPGGGDSMGSASGDGEGASGHPIGGGSSGHSVGGGASGHSGGGGSRGLRSEQDGALPPELSKAFLLPEGETSHRWSSPYSSVDLDDEIWAIRLTLPDGQNVDCSMCKSDITIQNLIAQIEDYGYDFLDTIYFVAVKGIGFEGMEALYSLNKVAKMLQLYKSEKMLRLTVIKYKGAVPPGLNKDVEDVTQISDGEEIYPVAIDISEAILLGTQQSCNIGQSIPVDVLDSDDDIDMGEYRIADHDRAVAEELRLVKEFMAKGKAAAEPKYHKNQCKVTAPAIHFEGDTDVEELWSEEEESEEAEEVHEEDFIPYKKVPFKKGPTGKGHHEETKELGFFFVPSSDEDSNPENLGDSDDDGYVQGFVNRSGLPRRMKKMKKRQWYDPNREDADQQLSLKMCFKDVYEFRVALRNYHIAQLRGFQYHRNCSDRVIVLCKNTKVTINWLAHQSEQAMRIDPNTCVDTLIDNAKQKFGVEVPRSKAYRARKKAFDVVIGDQKKQYRRLRDYLQAIIDTNPGSRCIVTTKEIMGDPSPNPRFHDLFICLNASKEGFLNGCRPFIEKEDTASWLWFLTQLRYCIGEASQFGTYTIMSDRQKGLIKAIGQVFPNSPSRYCLRHIYANFQKAGFRGEELKKYMFGASYSYTRSGFERAMEGLKKDCEIAYNWLIEIPVEAWARHAFDTVCKTDLVVNNLSEVFNKMILDVRNKPVQTMIDGIKDKLMVKYSATREKAAITRWEITPFYAEKLEEAKKFARHCQAKNAELGLWQVSTSGPGKHAVDLRARTCGCRVWDVTGIPCNHAISVIQKIKQLPDDYVHDFFKKPMYKEAFRSVIYPVPGPDDWPKTNTRDIDPPIFNEGPGRKQVKRKRGQFEVPAPRDSSRMASITCGNCSTVGHRYDHCDKPLKPELQLRKQQHRGRLAHTRNEGSFLVVSYQKGLSMILGAPRQP